MKDYFNSEITNLINILNQIKFVQVTQKENKIYFELKTEQGIENFIEFVNQKIYRILEKERKEKEKSGWNDDALHWLVNGEIFRLFNNKFNSEKVKKLFFDIDLDRCNTLDQTNILETIFGEFHRKYPIDYSKVAKLWQKSLDYKNDGEIEKSEGALIYNQLIKKYNLKTFKSY